MLHWCLDCGSFWPWQCRRSCENYSAHNSCRKLDCGKIVERCGHDQEVYALLRAAYTLPPEQWL